MNKCVIVPVNRSSWEAEVMRNRTDSKKRLFLLLIALFVFSVFTLSSISTLADTTSTVFEMEEVCVFDEPEIPDSFIVGVRAEIDFESINEVKSFPVFKSEKVLYGSVRLGRELFHPGSGQIYYFAIDESAGTDTGYDRCYFDLNGDKDLANDEVLNAQDSPPEGALWEIISAHQHICFETFSVSLENISTNAVPIEIMPRLTLTESSGHLMRFVAVKAQKGTVEIAGNKYNAYLGYPLLIYPAYDHPGTSLSLIPEKGPTHTRFYMNFLKSMQEIDGKLYHFSATPDGSELTAKLYNGPFGTFKVRSPQFFCPNKDVYGALASREAVVEINHPDNRDRKKMSSVKVPVGDYLPMLVDLQLDNMRISISDNYHSDGIPRDDSKEKTFPIKIREDKPFVLDFANEPEVIFASPAKDTTIKPGEELKVVAVLVDPKLDIMIRGLAVNREYGEVFSSIKSHLLFFPLFITLLLASIFLRRLRRRYRILMSLASILGIIVVATVIAILYSMIPSADKRQSNYKNIIPEVSIKNTTGQVVARGTMPFGWDGTCGYSWRIPEDLKINGDSEQFTICVEFNTKQLYGIVSSERKFTISRD